MRTRTAFLTGIGLCLVLAAILSAQNYSARSMRFGVPYAFVINDHILPAGTYDFAFSSKPFEPVKITAVGGATESVYIAKRTEPVQSRRQTPGPDKLVFHRLGDEYFLAEIHNFAIGGLTVSPCKRYKAAAKTGKPEIVEVVAGGR